MLLQVIANHQGCRGSFSDCAGDLLCAAPTGVTGGEHALQAGLNRSACGDEALLIGFDHVLDECGIGIESNEDERGGGEQFLYFVGSPVKNQDRFQMPSALELLNGAAALGI